MTTPNSPLSPSSVSASDDDDDGSYPPYKPQPAAAAAAGNAAATASQPPSASAATGSSSLPGKGDSGQSLPPLSHPYAEDGSGSSTRRHSLSSASSTFSSPHLLPSYVDTSVSSTSTPLSTPSSAASTPGVSPITHTHSLQQPQTSSGSSKMLAAPSAALAASASQTSPSFSSVGASPAASTSSSPSSNGGSAPSLTSDAAVLANSQTLARAMLAGQSSIVGSRAALSSFSSSAAFSASSLSQMSSSLSLPQHGYQNRPALPSPLASLPPSPCPSPPTPRPLSLRPQPQQPRRQQQQQLPQLAHFRLPVLAAQGSRSRCKRHDAQPAHRSRQRSGSRHSRSRRRRRRQCGRLSLSPLLICCADCEQSDVQRDGQRRCRRAALPACLARALLRLAFAQRAVCILAASRLLLVARLSVLLTRSRDGRGRIQPRAASQSEWRADAVPALRLLAPAQPQPRRAASTPCQRLCRLPPRPLRSWLLPAPSLLYRLPHCLRLFPSLLRRRLRPCGLISVRFAAVTSVVAASRRAVAGLADGL